MNRMKQLISAISLLLLVGCLMMEQFEVPVNDYVLGFMFGASAVGNIYGIMQFALGWKQKAI